MKVKKRQEKHESLFQAKEEETRQAKNSNSLVLRCNIAEQIEVNHTLPNIINNNSIVCNSEKNSNIIIEEIITTYRTWRF